MPKLLNREALGHTQLRQTLLKIVEAGLFAIDTESVTKKLIKITGGNALQVGGVPFILKEKGKIYFLGVGKCASEVGKTVERILGERLTEGLAIDVCEKGIVGKCVRYIGGTHPYPSEKNVSASKKVVDFLKKATEHDLIIFAISGGGSTLLCLPTGANTCVDEQILLRRLFAVGATIQEINTVRKHISLVRGGQLAKYAYPAKSVSLIFSDVPGNDLGFVASGPTVKDETSVQEAKLILQKYEIWEDCGPGGCGLVETPKDPKYFENVHNVLAVSNRLALIAMHDKAIELGYSSEIVSDRFQGEAREVGQQIADELSRSPHHSVLLYGGESTVTLDNKKGRGGRNAELALSALRFVGDNEAIVSVASDGRDNGDYAGAIADGYGAHEARKLGLNIVKYLANHDSINFYEKIGDYLVTGDTGSNVSDLVVAIKS